MGILTTVSEKLVYTIILNNPGIDVIQLRNKTNLPISIFIESINSLSEKNMITKAGTKLYANDIIPRSSMISHRSRIESNINPDHLEISYLESVTVPQIKPNEFYIPNQQKFFKSRRKLR